MDTPILNVKDTPEGRAKSKAIIAHGAELGATFCLIQHSAAEQLLNLHAQTIERIGDYTDMIREVGLIPGVTAHMPELLLFSDQNGYDIETYATVYNSVPRIWLLSAAIPRKRCTRLRRYLFPTSSAVSRTSVCVPARI